MAIFKLIVAYDGTLYHGFAKQNNVKTIQGKLEEAVFALTGQNIEVLGSGRTDKGVHAKGQCCMFEVETAIPTERMCYALNSKLPNDIVVKEVVEAEEGFHPRYNAKKKTYRYQILNAKHPDPFLRQYTYFYPRKLEVELMKKGATHIVGTHDFKCFCATGSTVISTERTVYDIQISKTEDLIQIDVCGNGFLYNMVRIIAGTLMEVGRERILPEEITRIIESKDRTLAGPTAPPEGLTLLEVNYQ